MCRICCGPASTGGTICFACRTISFHLGRPLAPVLPVSLCPIPGPLYAVLVAYKESALLEERRRDSRKVARLFGGFLAGHHRCITKALGGGPADLVLPVPSSHRPVPPLALVPGLGAHVARRTGADWDPGLIERLATPLGHMRPHPRAFAVSADARPRVGGARILLLDDTYVSGARSQSAAAALRAAGAHRVLIVPLGRILRPDRYPAHAALLRHSAAHGTGHGPCGQCG